jgi:hypothetical protein
MHQCFCSATLLWYATLPHCFDMLHWFWYAALLRYATLPHCFDMLHIATLLLFCYILIYMNATLLNDESGLSETSVATWTNIIVQLTFQLQTTWSRSDIWLSSSLSQSRWSFVLLLCHRSTCKAFSNDRSNTTLYFSTVCVFDRVQDNKLRSLMKKMSRKKKQQSFI